MNDFDTFWHEAKAALRVALQWFFLAVPMGLLCGFLGSLIGRKLIQKHFKKAGVL